MSPAMGLKTRQKRSTVILLSASPSSTFFSTRPGRISASSKCVTGQAPPQAKPAVTIQSNTRIAALRKQFKNAKPIAVPSPLMNIHARNAHGSVHTV